jgi:hypothetical protein
MEDREQAPAAGEGAPNEGATGHVDPAEAAADAATGAGQDAPASGDPNQGATGEEAAEGAAEKDPSDWVTGEEPMTAPQKSYLQTLCQEAGEEFDEGLTKAEASRKIGELQQRTGRGK